MKKSGLLVWLLTALLVGTTTYLFGFNQGKKFEEYKFVRVVDGDTLTVINSRDNREMKVRIWGIDSPELAECSGEEAKSELDKLIKMGAMDLEKIGFDSFGRLVSKVIIGGDDVAIKMLGSGMARIEDAVKEHIRAELKPTEEYLKKLREVEDMARSKKIGIWSQICLKQTKVRDPKCDIKGNYKPGKKEYYLPSCNVYETVVVQEKSGDKWFCSEEQASALGFVLALSCR